MSFLSMTNLLKRDSIMKQTAFYAIFLIALLSTTHASTYVFFQNNTDIKFTHTARPQSGGDLGYWNSDEYDNLDSSIEPFDRDVKILRVNRNDGITNGKYFEMNADLAPSFDPGAKISLRLRLKGQFVGSQIWGGVQTTYAQVDTGTTWYKDRVIHRQEFTLSNGKRYRLSWRFWATGGDDDVTFVLDEVERYQGANPADQQISKVLNIATYNIWQIGLSSPHIEMGSRTHWLDDWVQNMDVVVFNEVFDRDEYDDLVAWLKNSGYPHVTDLLSGSRILNGGVFIASRFPMTRKDSYIYSLDALSGEDKLSDKGIVYAQVDKHGQRYNIFATHANAADSDSAIAARNVGRTELLTYARSQLISSTQPVIYIGDMNVPDTGNNNEYADMLNDLRATDPPRSGEYKYTFDNVNNKWATGSQAVLDYVLYSNDHLKPKTAWKRVYCPRETMLDKVGLGENEEWRYVYSDLSDHYPIHARLTLQKARKLMLIILRRALLIRQNLIIWCQKMLHI